MYLFEGVQHFLPLAEVSEEQLQGSRHQRRVVVHGEVGQHPQEHTSAFVVHFQDAVSFAAPHKTQQHTRADAQNVKLKLPMGLFSGTFHQASLAQRPSLHTQLQTWPLLALRCAAS